MFNDKIAKQIIDFQKSAFDNFYGAVVTLQDQSQAALNTMLDKTPWVPREGKKAIDGWIQMYNTGRDEYKGLVDDGFEKLSGLCAIDKKPAAKTKSPKAKQAT